jgi:alkylated DNA nucleotide flippase Atl1
VVVAGSISTVPPVVGLGPVPTSTGTPILPPGVGSTTSLRAAQAVPAPAVAQDPASGNTTPPDAWWVNLVGVNDASPGVLQNVDHKVVMLLKNPTWLLLKLEIPGLANSQRVTVAHDRFWNSFVPVMPGPMDGIALDVVWMDFCTRVYNVVSQVPYGYWSTLAAVAKAAGAPQISSLPDKATLRAMLHAPPSVPVHRILLFNYEIEYCDKLLGNVKTRQPTARDPRKARQGPPSAVRIAAPTASAVPAAMAAPGLGGVSSTLNPVEHVGATVMPNNNQRLATISGVDSVECDFSEIRNSAGGGVTNLITGTHGRPVIAGPAHAQDSFAAVVAMSSAGHCPRGTRLQAPSASYQAKNPSENYQGIHPPGDDSHLRGSVSTHDALVSSVNNGSYNALRPSYQQYNSIIPHSQYSSALNETASHSWYGLRSAVCKGTEGRGSYENWHQSENQLNSKTHISVETVRTSTSVDANMFATWGMGGDNFVRDAPETDKEKQLTSDSTLDVENPNTSEQGAGVVNFNANDFSL